MTTVRTHAEAIDARGFLAAVKAEVRATYSGTGRDG
jgi:hypothetical protein